ncbi:MAG: hypothetical protein ACFFCQ_12165, partial [Promethearchaeota archaeon]
MSYERELTTVKVNELTPQSRNLKLNVQVSEIGESREVTSRRTGETNHVADVVVADETGCVTLTLWNEAINDFHTGKEYELSNVYCGLFRGHLRLNLGRYGTYTEISPEITDIDTENDMSEVVHEDRRRRRYRRDFSGNRGYDRDRG